MRKKLTTCFERWEPINPLFESSHQKTFYIYHPTIATNHRYKLHFFEFNFQKQTAFDRQSQHTHTRRINHCRRVWRRSHGGAVSIPGATSGSALGAKAPKLSPPQGHPSVLKFFGHCRPEAGTFIMGRVLYNSWQCETTSFYGKVLR